MKIQIVDNQDRPIGVKERGTLDDKRDIYRLSALWLTNSRGQTLIAKRSATKRNDPGKWGPAVVGTIDEGETYEENIYKEAMEEIGLEGVKFVQGPKIRVHRPKNYFCQWYLVTLDRSIERFTMQADEVDSLVWIDTVQMKQELKTNLEKYVPSMPQTIRDLGI